MSLRFERLAATLAALDLPADAVLFDALQAAHAEPGRHYHDARHVRACLDALEPVRALAREPDEIALALWFHDAVHDPRANDNEARSARWARDWLTANHAPAERAGRIETMILATRTHVATDADTALLLDLDLGILGQPEPVFRAYDAAIRREYHFVPEPQWRSGRGQVLGGFLARERIYTTNWFHERIEAQARGNLSRAIRSLQRQATPQDDGEERSDP